MVPVRNWALMTSTAAELARRERWHSPLAGPPVKRSYEPANEEANAWIRGHVRSYGQLLARLAARAERESRPARRRRAT